MYKFNVDRVPDKFSKLVVKKEFQWVNSHCHQIIINFLDYLSGHVADLVGFLPETLQQQTATVLCIN